MNKGIEKFGNIIFEFTTYNIAWEFDETGYIVEKDNKRSLILTNHGKPYVAKESELIEKIEEYKELIKKTEEALYILNQK